QIHAETRTRRLDLGSASGYPGRGSGDGTTFQLGQDLDNAHDVHGSRPARRGTRAPPRLRIGLSVTERGWADLLSGRSIATGLSAFDARFHTRGRKEAQVRASSTRRAAARSCSSSGPAPMAPTTWRGGESSAASGERTVYAAVLRRNAAPAPLSASFAS